MQPDREIVLDLSRLLSRLLHATPTGVDRVEMAYARELLRLIPKQLSFAAVNIFGRYGRIPNENALTFLDHVDDLWNGKIDIPKEKIKKWHYISKIYRLMWPQSVPKNTRSKRFFLQSSPHHLTNQKLMASILKKENAKFICLLHDLIPISYPEYARPHGAGLHIKRMKTIAELADGIIANSYDTEKNFQYFLKKSGRNTPIITAHLGVDITKNSKITKNNYPSLFESLNIKENQSVFIYISTIEPRKNHLLLLNIWRNLVTLYGDKAPYLVLIGRRGWENENILDMLDRCPAMQKKVFEFRNLGDAQMQIWLKQARALLMPSFAEGYGLPIAEAISLGVPVICSDIAAHREVGGTVPEYIDPIDGLGWQNAIIEYSQINSERAKIQKKAMSEWQLPSWDAHITAVLQLADML
ncbi:glycosyltransferase family 1 protein [Zymomonas sp.]|uniref:glycosyltransferase family 4 protein n=1 Tax=Zymomonas sp. TaxID=2068624 RepID=UPI0025F531DB|nr:glycosyltransferase family 1 protein [Zymomonas sp.]MCA1956373.1 glycosyltransferase family 4 protein [Zymomonas sp.]